MVYEASEHQEDEEGDPQTKTSFARQMHFNNRFIGIIIVQLYIYDNIYIWRFPEIGVPPNHPSIDGFPKKKKPTNFGVTL